jgi:hypothetical protein
LPVLLRPSFSDYPFGIFKLLSVNIYIFLSICSLDFHQNVNQSSATSFEDAKGVFSKRRLKEDRQYNDPPIARTIAMINILVEA